MSGLSSQTSDGDAILTYGSSPFFIALNTFSVVTTIDLLLRELLEPRDKLNINGVRVDR